MSIEWKPVTGAIEMTPLDLDAIPLSSGRHSHLNADTLPGADTSQPVVKTSLTALKKTSN